MTMELLEARKAIEALLYMTDHALTDAEICEIFDEKRFTPAGVREIVTELASDLQTQGSPLRITEVAGGFQMSTQPEYATFVRKLYKERLTVRLSASSLETLSIIAYKQPITRGDVEQIRGVEASGVMETLLERRLIKVVGRKETIGRPLLYGTTIEFLRHFGLRHLSELPDPNTLAPVESVTAGDADAELPGLAAEATVDAAVGDMAGELGGSENVDGLSRDVKNLESDLETDIETVESAVAVADVPEAETTAASAETAAETAVETQPESAAEANSTPAVDTAIETGAAVADAPESVVDENETPEGELNPDSNPEEKSNA